MNRKTALQILREWIEENSFDTENQAGRRFIAVDSEDLQTKLLSLLPVERKGIEDAYREGGNTTKYHYYEVMYGSSYPETGEVEQSDDKSIVLSAHPKAKEYRINESSFPCIIISNGVPISCWTFTMSEAWADAAQRIRNSKK